MIWFWYDILISKNTLLKSVSILRSGRKQPESSFSIENNNYVFFQRESTWSLQFALSIHNVAALLDEDIRYNINNSARLRIEVAGA